MRRARRRASGWRWCGPALPGLCPGPGAGRPARVTPRRGPRRAQTRQPWSRLSRRARRGGAAAGPAPSAAAPCRSGFPSLGRNSRLRLRGGRWPRVVGRDGW